MSIHRTPFRITVDQYDRMIAHRILTKEHRLELIRGELVAKMSIGDPHASSVKRLNSIFGEKCRGRAIIGIQVPVHLADSKPEPDVSLLMPRDDFYAKATPRPADNFLIVEVADTTLDYDRRVKLPLYAENGIVEYWIVNLDDKCLEVYRDPKPDGTYADVRSLHNGDSVEVAAVPGIALAVADMF